MIHLTRTASLTTTWNWLMIKLLAVKSTPEIMDKITPEIKKDFFKEGAPSTLDSFIKTVGWGGVTPVCLT